MKTSVFIAILIGAFILGAGLVWFLTNTNFQQAGTQVAPATTTDSLPGDRDGDGIADESDYYPNDPTQ